MTDNEIIKALECHCDYLLDNCWECPYLNKCSAYDDNNCVISMSRDALDLINRQKAEIERLKNKQKPTGASGYKIENGKVVFFTNMLGGYRHEYENLDEVVKTLNELLHEAYSKDEILFYYKRAIEDLKTAKSEAIKVFAENLKQDIKSHRLEMNLNGLKGTHRTDEMTYVTIIEYIDSLVEELCGKEKGNEQKNNNKRRT